MNRKSYMLALLILSSFLILILGVPGLASGGITRSGSQNLSGTAFSYQGFLTIAGSPAGGSYDFAFELYDAALDGNQVGSTVVHDDVPVSQGQFTVQLDFGDVFDGSPFWLQIGVSADRTVDPYSILTPRQALRPAPNALFAFRSDWAGLSGVPADLADGDSDSLAALSCTENQIALWNGVSWMCADDSDSLALLQCASGQIPQWNGSVWVCDPDDDSLAQLVCSDGQIIERLGDGWICGQDDVGAVGGGGDITGVYSGEGLTGGGPSGEITITVAFSGTGSTAAVAHSDHNHDATYYTEGELQSGSASVHWNNLTNVPLGISDGDDDTLGGLVCSEGYVPQWSGSSWVCDPDNDSLGSLPCADGQVAKFDELSVTWVCADDLDTVDDTVSFDEIASIVGVTAGTVAGGDHDHAGVYADFAHNHDSEYYTITALQSYGGAPVNWGNLFDVPSGLADGDDDTLVSLICGPGDIARWDGGAWQCTADYDALGSLPCANDQIPQWNGSAWMCSDLPIAGWSLTGNSGISADTNFLGTTDNVTLTLAVSGTAALRLVPTTWSPNLIGGSISNTVRSGVFGATIGGGASTIEPHQITEHFGTIGGGTDNTVGDNDSDLLDARYGTVSGGAQNTASSVGAAVGGGVGNTASNIEATVGGGFVNLAGGYMSAIGGGGYNIAGNFQSTVGGGLNNLAYGNQATIGGGEGNLIITATQRATISGGSFNIISGTYASIGGGFTNSASGSYSSIGGGNTNVITGTNGTIAGGHLNKVLHDGAFIGGGTHNQAVGQGAVVTGGSDNYATNLYAVVVGGSSNYATGINSFVGSGYSNDAQGQQSFVGGGDNNIAYGVYSAAVGGDRNYAGGLTAFVGGGYSNFADADYTTVGGGYDNLVTATYGTVGGGFANHVTGQGAVVSGGSDNYATNLYAVVGGGSANYATGINSFVGSGYSNDAQGQQSFVGGGDNNIANGVYSAAVGGDRNYAGGQTAFVGGGYSNFTDADYTTVGGGYNNLVTATYGTVGGGFANQVTGQGAVVSGGSDNYATNLYAVVVGGSANYATGINSFVGSGYSNDAQGQQSFVGGGDNNIANGVYSAVVGGDRNFAGGLKAYIGGGDRNYTDADYTTVGGGSYNVVTATYGTIAGGGPSDPSSHIQASATRNRVTDNYGTISGGGNNLAGDGDSDTTNTPFTTIGGGYSNIASADYATVPGGNQNVASGDGSLAAGSHANATHNGSFVWADTYTTTAAVSDRENQFKVRAWGGSRFEDGAGLWVDMNWSNPIDTSTGGYLSWGGVWTNSSDRAAKDNFTTVDGNMILAQLAEIPVSSWNYKNESESIRHIGPVAQDFYAAFGLGDSDKTIGTIDADGISLAAIQALYSRSQDLESENSALRQELAGLETRLNVLEQSNSTSMGNGLVWALVLGVVLLFIVAVAWILWRSGLITAAFTNNLGGNR